MKERKNKKQTHVITEGVSNGQRNPKKDVFGY
jgi:hypothetical protein